MAILALFLSLFFALSHLSLVSASTGWNYEHVGRDWLGTCANGTAQTPINIIRSRAVPATLSTLSRILKQKKKGRGRRNPPAAPTPTVSINYAASTSFSLKNTGHNVNVQPADGTVNTLTLNGVVYDLVQGHAHTYSEHSIDGLYAPMEFHLVHTKRGVNTTQYLVLGILFRLDPDGTDNDFVGTWLPYAPNVTNTVVPVPQSINFADIIFSGRSKFYSYHGSLTTPTCDETVTWLVVDPIYSPFISEKQVEELQLLIAAIYGGVPINDRPTQPVGGRTVYTFAANPFS